MSSANYRRILLKVSGEMLAGEQGYGIQPSILEGLASEIASVVALDIEVAVVIGGGNIFRGIAASASGMERASADYMGMLATVLNALALQNALERTGIMTRVQSAIEMRQLAEGYIRGHLRRRHRKPLLLDRYGSGAQSDGDWSAGHHERDKGRRHLRRRPCQKSFCQKIPDDFLSLDLESRFKSDGCHGHQPLHG